MLKRKNKKAAIELSIGTIVIIVLAMAMLVMGIVLIRKIGGGATNSVDILNDRIIGEITNLFADEGSEVIVKLGADQTAKVKQDTGAFRIAIGARKSDGSAITSRGDKSGDIKYKISLDTEPGNCVDSSSYGTTNTRKLFKTGLDEYKLFDRYQGSNAFALIELNIPDGVPICTQKVLIDVKETGQTNSYAGNFFIVQIQKKGFL